MVMIAAGGTRAVYRSVDDVPEPLRKQLVRSTTGLNSATVLIADRRGRQEIERAIRCLPFPMRGRLRKLILGSETEESAPRSYTSPRFLRAVGLALVGAASLLVWAALRYRG